MAVEAQRPPSAHSGAQPDTTGPAGPHWAVLPIILVGTFVITLDVFIVNVAIPATQRDLGASPAAIEFIVAGYALAYAAGLITGGRLGDLFGRRRVFVIGLALFTLASAACGLAPNAGVLIAARVAQGLASALMGPQVLAIIGVAYAGKARATAFNAYGLTLGLAGVFGQLIGGLLIHADIAGLGWRACYLVNVPVGVVTLLLAPRVLPESRADGRSRLDLGGMLLVSSGLVAVVLPLTEGRAQGWPLWTWLCLAASVVLLGAFGVHQHRLSGRRGSPLVDTALFKERAFSVGVITAVVYYSGMASFFLVLALYLQRGTGLSALQAGLVFLPLGVGFLATSLSAKALSARLGRQALALGAAILALGLGAQGWAVAQAGATGGVGWLLPGLALSGAGMGMVMAPLASTVLAGINPRHAGAASGVLSSAAQVGIALGVAIIGVVFYGALDSSGGSSGDSSGGVVAYGDAFNAGLLFLVPAALAVVALIQLLPKARPQR